jgi:hypothetical protein
VVHSRRTGITAMTNFITAMTNAVIGRHRGQRFSQSR